MKKKPTILVVGKEDPDLCDLREKYDLIFRDTDYLTSPFAQAKEMLTSLEGRQLDGVVGFHDKDSPVAAIIAQKCHLVGPPLYAVYLGHNKVLFSQHMKQEQLPYPDTTIINITSTTFPRFDYPIFIKPSKGRLSAFAFMLHSQQEFEEKLAWLNQQPRDEMYTVFEDFFLHFGNAYSSSWNWYLVQPFIDAEQYTVDAFVFDQKVHIIGVVQSIYTEDRKSFARFDLPGAFPKDLTGKLQDLLEKVVKTIGFDNNGFDLEFFLTPEGEIIIIELNTRISQGFNSLYQQYYVCSPHEMMIELCLGHMPSLEVKEKTRQISSFPLRVKHDHLVTRIPRPEEIENLKKTFDIANIEILVEEGKKLSDYWQDGYSYRYALIDIAGDNLDQIKKKYTLLLEHLPIELQKIEATPPDE
jgi:glutathione synthase/RimK-type ligase-like ATP-grasp enzyme